MRNAPWFEEKPITPGVTPSISIVVGEIKQNLRDPTTLIPTGYLVATAES
jgi:hypothetical protein